MLKKSGVAIILLIMLVSFTIGSVNTVSVSSPKNGFFIATRPGFVTGMPPMFSGITSGPVGHEHSPKKYDVILDMTGQNNQFGHDWHPPEFMPDNAGIRLRPCFDGMGDFIAGRMIVQAADENTPHMFPVKFFRHTMPGGMESLFAASYRMNETIKLNDLDGSFFTVNGEILLVNNSLVPQNATVQLAGDTYNNEITMGQTTWHQAQVSGSSSVLNLDLKWSDPTDDLRLMIYTPDGKVLGPYTDKSDNKADGRINLEIDNPSGVAAGTWFFKVTGTNVTGKDEYYIRTY